MPLTRPSATLSPTGRGMRMPRLPAPHGGARQSSPSPLWGEGRGEGAFRRPARPLTRPSATLSPSGRGNGGLGLPARRGIMRKSPPSPRWGEGRGEGAFWRSARPLTRPSATLSPTGARAIFVSTSKSTTEYTEYTEQERKSESVLSSSYTLLFPCIPCIPWLNSSEERGLRLQAVRVVLGALNRSRPWGTFK